jgi:DNA replication protein DnaC
VKTTAFDLQMNPASPGMSFRKLAGDEVLATAILVRLLHKCHVLDIKGRGYRLRELERSVKARL